MLTILFLYIFSPDLEKHFDHTEEVLSRLRKANLFAKIEKCEFCVTFLDFLCHFYLKYIGKKKGVFSTKNKYILDVKFFYQRTI